MLSRLLVAAFGAVALALPATATAGPLASGSQFDGVMKAYVMKPYVCGSTQQVSVSAPTRIDATIAGTNAGGFLFAQILGPAGDVVSNAGSYNTPAAGIYGVRPCFISDGIDDGQVAYVGMIATSAPH